MVGSCPQSFQSCECSPKPQAEVRRTSRILMLVALVGEVVSVSGEVVEEALVSAQVFVGRQCLRMHACCVTDAWHPVMGVALLSR